MHCVLFDDLYREHLLPLTYTKPVSELRVGVLTIRQKWEKLLGLKINSWNTEEYLSGKYPQTNTTDNLYINGHVCPTKELVDYVKQLPIGAAIQYGGRLVALRTDDITGYLSGINDPIQSFSYPENLTILSYAWDIFAENEKQLKFDFDLITRGRSSESIDASCRVINPENVFVEKGAKLTFATINASDGPVYIGTDAEVMEGALIRGPFALGEHSVVKMGAKVYGGTTIGPYSKVGGEISDTVIQGFSNKAHDGFLGHSVIGEWCNLGADTNVSNLKNSYVEVKLWDYPTSRFIRSGKQFCGLIMGDYSKFGINSMINSGTSVGVGCNLYGAGFPRNFIPSFSEGGTHGFKVNRLKDVFETAETVCNRRGIPFTEDDRNILTEVFNMTQKLRNF